MVRVGVREHNFSIENLKKVNDGAREPEYLELPSIIAKEELFDLPNDIHIMLARNNEGYEGEDRSQDVLTKGVAQSG